MHTVIVNAIADSRVVTLGYSKPNEVLTVRLFKPYAIERCQNGNTIVRGMCPHDGIPKSLTLSKITFAIEGDKLAHTARTLYASVDV